MKIALYALPMLLLAGCIDEEVKDVNYYVQNNQARAETLEACRNNPGEKALSGNCINASQALQKKMLASKEMPRL